MQKLLSLLLALVFLQSQAFALSGGPDYSGNGNGSVTGTYSGVLIPQALNLEIEEAEVNTASTSVGIFSISQPDVGVATGAMLLFVDGAAFNCTVTGVIDPGSGELRGVVDGTSTFNVVLFVPVQNVVDGVTTTTFEREEFPVFATGNIEAELTFGFDNQFTTQNTVAIPARLEGTSSIDIFFTVDDDGTPEVNQTAIFEVDGFKQSDTAEGATDLDFGTDFDFGGDL